MPGTKTKGRLPGWPGSEFGSQALLYGLLCAPVGLVIGFFVASEASDGVYRCFSFYAALAAFLMSAFLWWLMIQRSNKPSSGRAVAVGILSGLLSHWLCWFLILLWSNVDFWLLNGAGSSLGEAPMDPLPENMSRPGPHRRWR